MSVSRSIFLVQAHNDSVARSYEEALKTWRARYARDNGSDLKDVDEPDSIACLGDAIEASR